jgi:hypothetical protein
VKVRLVDSEHTVLGTNNASSPYLTLNKREVDRLQADVITQRGSTLGGATVNIISMEADVDNNAGRV